MAYENNCEEGDTCMPYKSTLNTVTGITGNMLRLLLLLIIFAATFYRPASVFPERLGLVIDGKANSVIVVPEDSSDKTRAAAEDLRDCLLKMSGADIPLLSEDTADVPAGHVPVFVGDTKYARSRGIDISQFPEDCFIVKTETDAVVLAGEEAKTRNGTRWAVCDLLTDQLGVRWIWPGETGTYIPRRSTVDIPDDLDIREEPRLFRRWLRPVNQEKHRDMYCESGIDRYLDLEDTYDRLMEEENAWLLHHRLGRSVDISYGHAFTDWWERYGSEKPGLFALKKDGERGPLNRPDFVKMCVSNPELWDMQLERFADRRRGNPDHHYLNAVENDGSGGFCTCPRCRAWDLDPDNAPTGGIEDGADIDGGGATGDIPTSLSDRYARWYNELAVRVRKIDQQASVVAYAYSNYREAPRKISHLEPNIVIGYVGFNGYPSSRERYDYYRNEWLGWSDKGASLFLRSNMLFMCGHGAPYIFTREVYDDWRFLLVNKLLATDFDCLKGYWATTGPTYYFLARLQWDTGEDIDRLMDEYCEAFGPAAVTVREYFDYWENFTSSLKENEQFMSSRREARIQLYPAIYTPEAIARGQAILDDARTALKGAEPEFIDRVRNLELGLEHTRLLVAALSDGIISNGPEGSTLMAFRRENAARNVVNPYFITWFEMSHRLF